ncbi:translocon-associated protein subunit alpha-like [Eucyclogobius newberryi]|uniref:translocon-associated protein subunit alpha-like n=1 Tax=Eucyclogobius newberryi TaxID=166745 RepID=UPI003B59A3E6
MFHFGSKLLLLLLLALPCALASVGGERDTGDEADPDVAVDEEEEEEEVEEVEDVVEEVEEDQLQQTEEEEEEEVSDLAALSSHPDADTTIVFTTGEEFPANEIVRFLVGFTNKGSQEFSVQTLEASFRYPQDFQFYIQNFTALPLHTLVKPQAQATFEYSFVPAQPMAGRPFGLVILLNYLDTDGNSFQTAIYNQTVTIIDQEEGLDGETIFLYIFLTGLVALMVFGVWQVLETRTRKRLLVKVEKGTGNMSDVDISWIPQETLNTMNRASPKTSPRKRAKRAAGTDQ